MKDGNQLDKILGRAQDRESSSRPPVWNRLAHPIQVQDLARATAFYQQTLGFRLAQSVPHCLSWMRHDGADILLLATSARGRGRGAAAAEAQHQPKVHRITTHGMARWFAGLESRLKISGMGGLDLNLQPWNALELRIEDSEGNTLVWVEWLSEKETRHD